jgi:probable rRNA maturation factor
MIEVSNLTTVRISGEFLKRVAKKVLEGEGAGRRKKELELSIVLVGAGRIKELNKKSRKKNKATDVLSFSYNGSGEIVICLRQVKKNAKRYKSTLEKELARVLIHGILHILGQDHETSKLKAKRMEKKQEHYLKLFS